MPSKPRKRATGATRAHPATTRPPQARKRNVGQRGANLPVGGGSVRVPDLQIENAPLASLKLWADNPRKNEAAVEPVLRSMAAFGWTNPILARREDRTVIAGHTRIEAAKKAGLASVPVIFLDLTEEQAKAAAIADNKTAQFAVWDDDKLATLLQQINAEGNLAATGFDDSELKGLLARLNQHEETFNLAEAMAAAPELVSRVQVGEIWQLGRHRLMCGDSTNAEQVRRLMNGQRAVLFATDPPYLVNYDGTNHPGTRPKTNKDWSATYVEPNWDDAAKGEEFYRAFCQVAINEAIAENAAWYCWHASRNQAMLERVWESVGAFVHQQIVWVKSRGVLTRSAYLWQHEPCFFGWIRRKKPAFEHAMGGDFGTTVWQIPSSEVESADHPTCKPNRVFMIPIEYHTRPGAICYEPFSGSGSQIIAGEQTGRAVYAMEQEPQYCEVAIARFESYTGESAVKVDG